MAALDSARPALRPPTTRIVETATTVDRTDAIKKMAPRVATAAPMECE